MPMTRLPRSEEHKPEIHTLSLHDALPISLRDRINDSKSRVLITADGAYRRGTLVPLKKNADDALTEIGRAQAGNPHSLPTRRSSDLVARSNQRFKIASSHHGGRRVPARHTCSAEEECR